MHTTISQSSPTLADLKQVMIRIQIAALETLERCMQNLDPTGDDKKDRATAQQLNRQRMSATQTLLHCRTMFRELREAEAQDHRIAQEKKQAEKKAIFDLANLRHLHRIYPNDYDNPDETNIARQTSRDRQGAASPPSPAPENESGEGGDRSQIDRRMRGRPEPPDDQISAGATGGLSASAGLHAPEPPSDIATPQAPPPKPLTPLEAHEAELKRQMIERIRKKREAMKKR